MNKTLKRARQILRDGFTGDPDVIQDDGCYEKGISISNIFHILLNLDSTALTEKLKIHNKNLRKKNKSPEVDELTFVNHSNYRSLIKKHIDHHLDDNLFASLDAFYENNISSDFSLIN